MSIISWARQRLNLLDGKRWSMYFGNDSWAGEPVSLDTAMQDGAWAGCVKLYAQTISTLPLGLWIKQNEGRKDAGDHPLQKLVREEPNADQDAAEFWENLIAWWIGTGNAVAEKIFDGNNPSQRRLVALDLLCPFHVTIDRLTDGSREYHYRAPGKAERTIPEDRIFHLRGLSFGDEVGINVLSNARQSLSTARATARAASAHFANGMRPSGWLVYKGGVTLEQDQREMAKQNLINPMIGAENAGKIGILEGDFDYRQMTISPEDGQLLESRRFSVEDICFLPETKILTITGPVRIDEVQVGDLVLTHRGRWRPVRAVMKRPYVGNVVTTEARGLNPVTATANHPFYVQPIRMSRTHKLDPDGAPVWRPASDLRPCRRQTNGRRARGGCDALTIPRISAETSFAELDLGAFTGPNAVVDDAKVRVSSNGRATGVRRFVTLDYDFGWLCGLYAADGSTTDRQSVIYLGGHEAALAEIAMERFAKCLGLSSTQAVAGPVIRLTTSNRVAAALWSQFGGASHLKHLPAWCMLGPQKFRQGLIDGLVAGDGFTYRGRTGVKTTSEHLAWQIRLLMWSFGRNANVSLTASGSWEINGRSGVALETYTVEWRNDPVRRGEMGCEEDHVYFSLNAVEQRAWSGTVFNLEVEEDESYTTEGGCVHNCRWHGVPPILLSHASTGQTMWGSGIEQIVLGWYVLQLRPRLVRLERAMKRQLMTAAEKQNMYFEHNAEGLLRGDSAARAEFYWKMLQVGAMTPNQICDKENLPRFVGGDRHFVNTTLAPLDEEGMMVHNNNAGAPVSDNAQPEAPRQRRLEVVK